MVAIGTDAVFNGNVVGSGSGSNTLQLMAGGTGSLSGLGSLFQNFATVSLLDGALWNLDGRNSLGAGARDRPCRSPGMANGRCRMHGGTSPGAPRGNSNALKHGRYTAQAIAERREVAALIRAARQLASAAAERYQAPSLFTRLQRSD